MKSSIFLLILSLFTFFSPKHNFEATLIGTVTDARTGEALVGASVVVAGTNTGVTTDVNGAFSLKVSAETVTLDAFYVGFQTMRITKTGLKNGQTETIDFKLNDAAILQEVVVIGYGSAPKKSVTAAISSRVAGLTMSKTKRQQASVLPNIPSAKLDKKERRKLKEIQDSLTKRENYSSEEYGHWVENEFKTPKEDPLSTFSIDVDRASYANVRRFITHHQKPPTGAVRIEEMVNYFDYNYPQPTSEHPLSITTEIGVCPWNPNHALLHVGLQGKKIDLANAPHNNLVFLLDVSGSMSEPNKLPLVKEAFSILVNNLRENDRVAIVVYAGAAGCVLPSTSGMKKGEILAALDNLQAGGSTAGGAGIELAYKIAQENFIKNGNNRVILATDGDFNVGASSEDDLVKLIEKKRQTGVFLSVLGFGMGNYKDSHMEKLADKGNGNYAYIDNSREAQKVFGKEMGGTLYTIAKDVKFQLEFNPSVVAQYRLVGYENRILNHSDFNDDTKDAGEIGAGHTVTALYEIIPVGVQAHAPLQPKADKLRYQQLKETHQGKGDEWIFMKLRYKKPDGDKSILISQVVDNQLLTANQASDNFRFSAAVAGFGQILRESKFTNNYTLNLAAELAQGSLGKDTEGYRAEFVELIRQCERLNWVAKK